MVWTVLALEGKRVEAAKPGVTAPSPRVRAAGRFLSAAAAWKCRGWWWGHQAGAGWAGGGRGVRASRCQGCVRRASGVRGAGGLLWGWRASVGVGREDSRRAGVGRALGRASPGEAGVLPCFSGASASRRAAHCAPGLHGQPLHSSARPAGRHRARRPLRPLRPRALSVFLSRRHLAKPPAQRRRRRPPARVTSPDLQAVKLPHPTGAPLAVPCRTIVPNVAATATAIPLLAVAPQGVAALSIHPAAVAQLPAQPVYPAAFPQMVPSDVPPSPLHAAQNVRAAPSQPAPPTLPQPHQPSVTHLPEQAAAAGGAGSQVIHLPRRARPQVPEDGLSC